jgi:predicted GNAT superfamily acetyltransferase
MTPEIQKITDSYLPAIKQLNNEAVPHVNLLDQPRLRWLLDISPYCRIALLNQHVAGFIITVPSKVAYSSYYYGWFEERYTDFLYIDRIVIAKWARRQGIGTVLYQDVEEFAVLSHKLLVTDVYTVPPNSRSLAFHQSFGFQQVGVQHVENGTKTVVKLAKSSARSAEVETGIS